MAQSKWDQLERKHGKPIADVLAAAFSQYKTQSAVARELGVTQSTIWMWLLKLELDIDVQLVPRKRVPAQESVAPGQLSFVVPGE